MIEVLRHLPDAPLPVATHGLYLVFLVHRVHTHVLPGIHPAANRITTGPKGKKLWANITKLAVSPVADGVYL